MVFPAGEMSLCRIERVLASKNQMRMKKGWRKWIGHGYLNFQVGFFRSGPEHKPSQKESSLPITIFAMAMLVVRECNLLGVAINPRVTKLHHEGMTGS